MRNIFNRKYRVRIKVLQRLIKLQANHETAWFEYVSSGMNNDWRMDQYQKALSRFDKLRRYWGLKHVNNYIIGESKDEDQF